MSEAERFVLKREGSQFIIERHVVDPSFGDPPFWVTANTFGPFRDREAARSFMVERRSNPRLPLGGPYYDRSRASREAVTEDRNPE